MNWPATPSGYPSLWDAVSGKVSFGRYRLGAILFWAPTWLYIDETTLRELKRLENSLLSPLSLPPLPPPLSPWYNELVLFIGRLCGCATTIGRIIEEILFRQTTRDVWQLCILRFSIWRADLIVIYRRFSPLALNKRLMLCNRVVCNFRYVFLIVK